MQTLRLIRWVHNDSVRPAWHCCNLEIWLQSMKVVWTGKAQWVVPSCKVWYLWHLQCPRKSQHSSFWHAGHQTRFSDGWPNTDQDRDSIFYASQRNTLKDGCAFNSPVLLSASGDSWPVGVQTCLQLTSVTVSKQWFMTSGGTDTLTDGYSFKLTNVTVSKRWLVTSGGTDTLTDGCAFSSPVLLSASGDSWPVGVQTRSKMAVLSTHQCYCQLAVTRDQWGYRHVQRWLCFQLTSVTVS